MFACLFASERFKTIGTYVLSNLCDGLLKSADELAQKADTTGKLVWITKSNSLRRTAKLAKTLRTKL